MRCEFTFLDGTAWLACQEEATIQVTVMTHTPGDGDLSVDYYWCPQHVPATRLTAIPKPRRESPIVRTRVTT